MKIIFEYCLGFLFICFGIMGFFMDGGYFHGIHLNSEQMVILVILGIISIGYTWRGAISKKNKSNKNEKKTGTNHS